MRLARFIYVTCVVVGCNWEPPSNREGPDTGVSTIRVNQPRTTDTGPTTDVFRTVPGTHDVTLHLADVGSYALRVDCVAAKDTTEAHHIRTQPGASTASIYGLLADTDYFCNAASDDLDPMSFEFATQPLPDPTVGDFDLTTVQGRGGVGWTLFNQWIDEPIATRQRLIIVDPAGRPRWVHDIPFGVGVGVDASLFGAGQLLIGGGPGLVPQLIDLSGQVIWSSTLASGTEFHHHAGLTANRNVIALLDAGNTDGITSWRGYQVQILIPNSAIEQWNWNSQSAFDSGHFPAGPADNSDPYHANAITEMSDSLGDGVLVSTAGLNRIIRIDRTTDEIVWELGEDLDFTLLNANGTEADPSLWFSFPHDPAVDGNDLWIHDNGTKREASAVVRLTLDQAAMTATIAYRWTQDGWFEPLFGDVDPLDGGTVLVTRGKCWGCMDHALDPNRQARLTELDPTDDTIVWELAMRDRGTTIYRADRVAPCDLFSHSGYCPELLD